MYRKRFFYTGVGKAIYFNVIGEHVKNGYSPLFSDAFESNLPALKLTVSPSGIIGHSKFIPQPSQLLAYQLVKLNTFSHLLTELFSQHLHLVGEGFVIILYFFSANYAGAVFRVAYQERGHYLL